MLKNKSLQRIAAKVSIRVLKIEADGDAWKGRIKSKIRLKGRWLEQAGFNPGRQVEVTCVAPGLIELRTFDASPGNESNPITTDQAIGSIWCGEL